MHLNILTLYFDLYTYVVYSMIVRNGMLVENSERNFEIAVRVIKKLMLQSRYMMKIFVRCTKTSRLIEMIDF